MEYYVIGPEIAGALGVHTSLDRSCRPPRIWKLHYDFDGWLGDELLETMGCFIATTAVVDALGPLKPTGVQFDQVEISKSRLFEDLHPRRNLPEFVWLKITGTAGKDDFGLSDDQRLVISERVRVALCRRRTRHCTIAPYIRF